MVGRLVCGVPINPAPSVQKPHRPSARLEKYCHFQKQNVKRTDLYLMLRSVMHHLAVVFGKKKLPLDHTTRQYGAGITQSKSK